MLINNPQRIESYLQYSPAGIALSGSLLSPDPVSGDLRYRQEL